MRNIFGTSGKSWLRLRMSRSKVRQKGGNCRRRSQENSKSKTKNWRTILQPEFNSNEEDQVERKEPINFMSEGEEDEGIEWGKRPNYLAKLDAMMGLSENDNSEIEHCKMTRRTGALNWVEMCWRNTCSLFPARHSQNVSARVSWVGDCVESWCKNGEDNFLPVLSFSSFRRCLFRFWQGPYPVEISGQMDNFFGGHFSKIFFHFRASHSLCTSWIHAKLFSFPVCLVSH